MAWPLWWLDLALALLVAEALLLAFLAVRRSRAALPAQDWLWMLGAGGALLAAMRAALGGAPMPGVLALLALAGLCHGLDLRSRRRAQVRRVGVD